MNFITKWLSSTWTSWRRKFNPFYKRKFYLVIDVYNHQLYGYYPEISMRVTMNMSNTGLLVPSSN